MANTASLLREYMDNASRPLITEKPINANNLSSNSVKPASKKGDSSNDNNANGNATSASLLHRLAGPSTGKAGLAKDQTDITRVIAEASEGSKFYQVKLTSSYSQTMGYTEISEF